MASATEALPHSVGCTPFFRFIPHSSHKASVLKHPLLPLAILFVVPTAFAQQPPSAGSQLQQIPPAPMPREMAPTIRIEPTSTPTASAPNAVKILVNRLRVSGSSVYPESELLALTGFQPGSELTLADLRAMAQKITGHYRSRGYFVAQAYLPPQEIKDGAVTIAVLEGQLGKLDVRNQSALSDAHIQRQLAGLNSGDVIRIEPSQLSARQTESHFQRPTRS